MAVNRWSEFVLKELYVTKYDPLSISYTVQSGTEKILNFIFSRSAGK